MAEVVALQGPRHDEDPSESLMAQRSRTLYPATRSRWSRAPSAKQT